MMHMDMSTSTMPAASPNATTAPIRAQPFCKLDGPCWGMNNNFFIAIGSNNCINFLFLGWCANSKERYIGSLIGCFLIALGIEGFGYFRRQWLQSIAENKPKCANPAHESVSVRLGHYAPSLMYGMQMALAYFVMLLVMSYETLFFLSVVTGYVVGHALFSVYLPRRQLELKLANAECPCEDDDPKYERHDSAGRLPPAVHGLNEKLIVDQNCQDDEGQHVAVHSPCCGGTSQ